MICKFCGKQLYGNPKSCPYCHESFDTAYRGVPDQKYSRETIHQSPPTGAHTRNAGKAETQTKSQAKSASAAAQNKTTGTKSSDKGSLWHIIFFLLALFLLKEYTNVFDLFSAKEQPVETSAAETATPQSDRYLDEIIMDNRDSGPCGRMVGDIGVMYFFMDDPDSIWTRQEIDTVLQQAYEEMDQMASQANSWGVDLTFHQSWEHRATAMDVRLTPTSVLASSIIQDTGRSSSDFNRTLAEEMNMPQAYPVFFFKDKGRDFTQSGNGYEMCILFEHAAYVQHESCHIFGAKDFYYSDEVLELANRFLPNSIMAVSDSVHVDDLTAYLMGWTDSISSDTQSFLNSISGISQADLDAAHEADTLTGYGTKDYSNGTRYEGNLVMGVPHGPGTMYFTDGDVFEGYYNNGDPYYGTFAWANGTRYEGDMSEYYPHGEGTMYYADGQVRTGSWNMGTFVG